MAAPAADGAIRDFFSAAWGNTSPIAYENEDPPSPWPPVNGDSELIPWVFLETVGTGSELAGASGLKGSRLWRDYGLIHVHAFVPIGSGKAQANSLAKAAGEIFRAKEFNQGANGQAIRTLAPAVSGGGSASDNDTLYKVTGTNSDQGVWFRSTMTVEFSYYYRG